MILLQPRRIASLQLFFLLFPVCLASTAMAQMQGMHHGVTQDSSMSMQMDTGIMRMPGIILLTDPMQRDGSGTSWVPDNSPMHALHGTVGMWNAMLHGQLTLRYTAQDAFKSASRGASRFSGPNWVMGMLSRPLGPASQIGFRAMLSLDRLTEGGSGYPLLQQTGESWNGRRLVDEQHPHDLFMELSTAYSIQLGEHSALGVYLAYPGEPALGPPTFMHRPSAHSLIDAPLSHHWQDATHISFGVATLGWQFHQVKLETSIFTGREPDENRWNFDKPRFDSYSGRISFNPTEELALQVSRGFLKSPELLEPGIDQLRSTASVVYGHRTSPEHSWYSTVAWGMNTLIGEQSQHSLLVESNLRLGRQTLFGRCEAIEKSSDELGLERDPHRLFTVMALTLGTSRIVVASSVLDFSIGIQASIYQEPADLQPVYGKIPVSLELFMAVNPSPMHMIASMTHE